MGFWYSLQVMPATPLAANPARMEARLRDLMKEPLVTGPARILCGDMRVHYRLDEDEQLRPVTSGEVEIGSLPGYEDLPMHLDDYRTNERVRETYAGPIGASLLEAVRAAPMGVEDVCVVFDGLDWEVMGPPLREMGAYNSELYVVALARPQIVLAHSVVDPDHVQLHPGQLFMSTWGKAGLQRVARTPLEPLLERHLGPRLVVQLATS